MTAIANAPRRVEIAYNARHSATPVPPPYGIAIALNMPEPEHSAAVTAMMHAGDAAIRDTEPPNIDVYYGAIAATRRQRTPGHCAVAHAYEPVNAYQFPSGHDIIDWVCQHCGTLTSRYSAYQGEPDPNPGAGTSTDSDVLRWLLSRPAPEPGCAG